LKPVVSNSRATASGPRSTPCDLRAASPLTEVHRPRARQAVDVVGAPAYCFRTTKTLNRHALSTLCLLSDFRDGDAKGGQLHVVRWLLASLVHRRAGGASDNMRHGAHSGPGRLEQYENERRRGFAEGGGLRSMSRDAAGPLSRRSARYFRRDFQHRPAYEGAAKRSEATSAAGGEVRHFTEGIGGEPCPAPEMH
jgi:hypothetical protein